MMTMKTTSHRTDSKEQTRQKQAETTRPNSAKGQKATTFRATATRIEETTKRGIKRTKLEPDPNQQETRKNKNMPTANQTHWEKK